MMKFVLGMLISSILGGIASAQSIQTRPATPPRDHLRVIDYDNEFLFVSRNYGDQRDPQGNSEPGLFIHSRKQDRWLQIEKISTQGGQFGKSQSDDPQEQRKLTMLSVSWDFTPLAKQEWVALPLMTSGSIAFPDQVVLDEQSGRYELRFFSRPGVKSAETRLYINRKDLRAAFEQLPRN